MKPTQPVKEKRHTCQYCNRKRIESEMKKAFCVGVRAGGKRIYIWQCLKQPCITIQPNLL